MKGFKKKRERELEISIMETFSRNFTVMQSREMEQMLGSPVHERSGESKVVGQVRDSEASTE